jgi:hypothetical protein
MKRILGFLVPLIVAVSLNSAQAAVTTVDLYNQFPDAQGQRGFYAYGYQAGREVPYRQLPREDSYYFSTPEQLWHIPFVRKIASPWIAMAPSAAVQCGTVYGAENAVLAWRAPQTNIYAISGQFNLPEESGGGDVNVYIRKNDTIIWGPKNIFLWGTQDFNVRAILQENDLLYFGVDAGADDICDTTQLKGEISYPAPYAGAACSLLLLD